MSSVADIAAPAGAPGQVGLADLESAAEMLAGVAAGLVPGAVPLSEVGEWWEAVQRLVRLAGSLETLLAARLAESGGWQRAGYRNPAEQIAAVGGTTVGAARELLSASERVGSLPGTEAALRAGDLSVAETVTIASAAAVNPGAEESLLGLVGRASLGELRQKALAVKAAADPDPEATHRRIHAERRLTWRTDTEGTWNLYARGTVDDGARITTVLEPIIDRLFTDARRRGEPEAREAFAFDRTARQGGVAVEGEEICEIAGVGPIPVHLARELLGGAVLKLVITKGRDVANITHLGRGPSAAQKVALAWTAPICPVEGCNRQRLKTHHTEPFAQTHHTRLAELEQLCPHHHDLQRRGWTLSPGPGPRHLIPPTPKNNGTDRQSEGECERAPP